MSEPPSLQSMYVEFDPTGPHPRWTFTMVWHVPRAPDPGWRAEVYELGSGESVARHALGVDRSSDRVTEWSTPVDDRAEICFEARVRSPADELVATSGPSCVALPREASPLPVPRGGALLVAVVVITLLAALRRGLRQE